jgi:hypothetical protein
MLMNYYYAPSPRRFCVIMSSAPGQAVVNISGYLALKLDLSQPRPSYIDAVGRQRATTWFGDRKDPCLMFASRDSTTPKTEYGYFCTTGRVRYNI